MAPVGKRPYDSTGFRLGEFDAEESNHSGRGGAVPARKSDSKISGPSEKGAAVCKGVLFVLCGEYTSSQQPKPLTRLRDRYDARPHAMRGSCSPLTVGAPCISSRKTTNLALGRGFAHQSAPTSRTLELNVGSRNEIRPDFVVPHRPAFRLYLWSEPL